jgi:Tol biopolymer transport system component
MFARLFLYDVNTKKKTFLTGPGTPVDPYSEYGVDSPNWFSSGDSTLYFLAGYEEDGWPAGAYVQKFAVPPILPYRILYMHRFSLISDEEAVSSNYINSPNGFSQVVKRNLKNGTFTFLTNFMAGRTRAQFQDELQVQRVSVSPDKKKIAFLRNHDLWIMNIDGSGLNRLTNMRLPVKPEDWNPEQRYDPLSFAGNISWNKSSTMFAFSGAFPSDSRFYVFVYDTVNDQFLTLR